MNELLSMVFLGRLLITAVVVTVTGATTAWFVADWAIEKALTSQDAHIRTLDARQIEDKREVTKSQKDSNDQLRTAIEALAEKFDDLNNTISNTNNGVTLLAKTIEGLDGQLQRSVRRQEAFERSVMQRLLLDPAAYQDANFDAGFKYWTEQGVSGELLKTMVFSPPGTPIRDWSELISNAGKQ